MRAAASCFSPSTPSRGGSGRKTTTNTGTKPVLFSSFPSSHSRRYSFFTTVSAAGCCCYCAWYLFSGRGGQLFSSSASSLSPAVGRRNKGGALVRTMATSKAPSRGNNKDGDDADVSSSAALKELWAGAYDAWIDCFGTKERILYMKPSASSSKSSSATPAAFPSWLKNAQTFALTAHNPYGKQTSDARNAEANEKLEEKLRSLVEKRREDEEGDATARYWRSFGFSSKDDWREDGFAVAFSLEDEKAERDIVELAKEFEQGAIYKYRWMGDERRMERKTVGALMPETEETVIVETCEKPVGVEKAEHVFE